MSRDIVERLHELDLRYDDDGTAYALAAEAADEIERLQAHNLALSETSLGELIDEQKPLRAALSAIDKLHQRDHRGYRDVWCVECSRYWPCPTARLLHPEEGPS